MPPDELSEYHLPLRRGRYDKADVDRLLADIGVEHEALRLERDELRGRVEALEAELQRFRDLDHALRDSLLAGQRTATDVVRAAEARSQRIIAAADVESEQIVAAARAERDRIEAEVKRLMAAESQLEANYRAFVLTAINVLEERGHPTPEAEALYASERSNAGNRERTPRSDQARFDNRADGRSVGAEAPVA